MIMANLKIWILLCLETVMAYPVMFAPPTLGPPIITNSGHDFTQSCHINYKDADPDAVFVVTWLFDDVIYKTVTLKGGVLMTSLDSSDWKRYLGKRLSCSVQSYLITNPKPKDHSPPMESDRYLGIITFPQSGTYEEGDHSYLTIKSTLPIVCQHLPLYQCRLVYDINVVRGDQKEIFFDRGCSLKLEGSKWDVTTSTVETRVQMTRRIEPFMRVYKKEFTLNFTLNHQQGDIQLSTAPSFSATFVFHNTQHNFCLAIGTSFFSIHRTDAYYDEPFKIGPHTGDFLMYRSKIFEVQTRHWRPVGGSSMVCGVAFQYGGTLIKVDMCSADPSVTAPVLTQGENNPDDVRVYMCGDLYEVVTADDTRLSIAAYPDHLDLKLHVPNNEYHAEGICYFRHLYNTLQPEDVHHYRVYESKSYFADAAIPFFQPAPQQTDSVHYCGCGDSITDCHPFRAVADPASPVYYDQAGKRVERVGCTVAVPRTLNPLILPGKLMYLSGPSLPNEHTPYEYRDACDKAIRHHTNTYCIGQHSHEFNIFVTFCTMSINSADDVENSGASAAQGFNWYCQEKSLNSFNSYITNATGHDIPPPEVTSDMCSGVCSMSGHCFHGVCACDEGYKGVNCAVNVTSEPVITDILGLKCNNLVLMTRNIYPSPQLDVIVNVTDGQSLPQSFHLQPVYENKFSVSLHTEQLIESLVLKDHTVIYLNISISSDGVVYSDSVNYTIFDDRCRLCGVGQGCLNKENACHIDGRCYSALQQNKDDKSELCDPDVALIRWSKAQQHHLLGTGDNNVPAVGK